jgi:sugar-specific transcriptional regulator TrmB
MIDGTITVGNIIEIITIAGGGITFMVKLLAKFDIFSKRLDRLDNQMERVETAMAKLSEVTAQQATQNGRIDSIESRLNMLSSRIDDNHQAILKSIAQLFADHIQNIQQNITQTTKQPTPRKRTTK